MKVESKVGVLWGRGVNIWRRRGFLALIKGTFLYLLANGLSFRAIRLFENDLSNLPENKQKKDNWELIKMSSPVEVDELVAMGFNFDNYNTFFRDISNLKETLKKGALLLGIFVDKQLAHTKWVALTEKAKQDFDAVPYKVNFEGGEVCHGGSETFPQYRGQGLHSYALSQMYSLFKKEGYVLDRCATVKNNAITQHVHQKFGSRNSGEGILIRFLLWSFWLRKS
jgi:GNAT superfamily N-acetyltransferase